MANSTGDKIVGFILSVIVVLLVRGCWQGLNKEESHLATPSIHAAKVSERP